MIYFDNGATGGFKPNTVYDCAMNVLRYLSANPGRSGHRLSLTGANLINECRQTISKRFGANEERVIFTKNCTEALNTAIFGCYKLGGHVITTVYEHNSVLRPLTALQQRGEISLSIVSGDTKSLPKLIAEQIKKKTCLVVTTACSNVTGEFLPIKQIGETCAKFNIPYLVDGAQAGGHVPLNLEDDNISMLALAGHKGLHGIMGSGVLLLKENITLTPLIYGGTGTETFNLSQPEYLPERLESGTQNLPAISALNEGVKYTFLNMEQFSKTLLDRTKRMIEELSKIERVKCFSTPNPAGIVSFLIDGIASTELADRLNYEFDVAVRGGFHCAPLIHKYLKTENEGLLRASVSAQNSSREISYFIKAINTIARG